MKEDSDPTALRGAQIKNITINTDNIVFQGPMPPSIVTRAGSGFVFSIRVQNGMAKKNKKYKPVHTCARKVRSGVGAFTPNTPRITKQAAKTSIAPRLKLPLYLIDLTGLRSNHGNTNKIAMAAAITKNPANLSGTALSIE